jgi:dTDP-4-dehydrorhamnose 3,5-epimerase
MINCDKPFVRRINSLKDVRGEFIKIYPLIDYLFDFHDCVFNFTPKDVFITKSYKDVFRGMHRQIEPNPCSKLVYLVDGEIIDYIVDMANVSTASDINIERYAMSSNSNNLIYVPQNYAHGFRVLSESATLLYIYSDNYSYSEDVSVNLFEFINDLDQNKIIMSDRDRNSISLNSYIELITKDL